MNGRRAAIGLSLLCVLVFCAFAAPSAQALKGTTTFTCIEKDGGKFLDAHCLNSIGGFYEHQAITEGVETNVETTNEKTASETAASTTAVLKGAVGGVALEFKAKKVSSSGILTNEKGPPMKAKGTATITYTELEVAGSKCEIAGGKIVAEANAETKTNSAGEMWVEFKGKKEKEVFTEFEIVTKGAEKCALNKVKVKVKGAAIGTPTGATLEFKEKEPKNTLELGEVKKPGSAEFTGITTVKGSGNGNAIVATTTES